ncbi:uncharacterized protein LOC110848702 [Folsomia candida]|uniref:uncharacterized protein LOC110848702 n=1 Tax=Folsomia candida TaxID=158441 RepID=UPI000B8FAB59|nr:uncharacterized protein LOC110848702 [Folsomia candida]
METFYTQFLLPSSTSGTSTRVKMSSILLLVFTLLITGLDGLRNVRLEGPHHVRSGEDVILRCNYDLDNDSIYVVKFYRDSNEFYRFVPKEVPPKRFFPSSGLAFNEVYCNEHDIFLRNVSLETTGRFKCAVSAEMTFQTFIAAQDLVIVEIDYSPPLIEVDQPSYYPGENAKANCSVGQVSHSLNFTWFINDQEVPKALHRQITIPDADVPSLMKSVSLLQFEMGTTSFTALDSTKGGGRTSLNGDDTRLKCRAELFDLYSEYSKEIVIQTTQPRYSPSNQDTLRRSSPPINGGAVAASSSPSPTVLSSWRNLILLMIIGWTGAKRGLHFHFCL